MREIVKNLQKARDLITPGGSWCINYMGQTKDGTWCRPDHNDCVARCALGVIEAATGRPLTNAFDCPVPEIIALDAMIPDRNRRSADGVYYSDRCPSMRVANYNNASTHAEVLAWFDDTIAFQKTAPSK